MLGLGISKSAQSVKSGIVKLLNSLKRRAEYFENKKDSKSEIKALKDYDLLDKATILLTPTATSDARVHSVKTYTGDELITNGNFSTSDLSSFGNIYATISIDNERLKVVPNASQGYGLATVTWGSQVGDVFLVKATAYKGNATSTVIKTHSGITIDNITKTDDEWTYEAYGVATSTQSIIRLQVNGADGVYGYFDNISVTNVSSDFDFDRASSATRINSDGLVQDMQSITDPELVLNGDFEELGDEEITNGSFDTDSNWTLTQATISNGVASFATTDGSFAGVRQSVFTTGKTYLISLDVSDLVGTAEVNTNGGTSIGLDITTNGTKSFYMKAENTDIEIKRKFGVTNVSATIDNVSVKQVDPNNRWTTYGDVDFNDGKATVNIDGGGLAYVGQSYSFINGNTYKLNFTVNGTSGKQMRVQDNGSNTGGLTLADGTTTLNGSDQNLEFIWTANANSNNLVFTRSTNTGDWSFSIDNISVKDITFSTDVDLARINYDSNGENGHILLEPTSTNLFTYSEDFSDSSWSENLGTVTLTSEVAPDGTTNSVFNYVGSNSNLFTQTQASGVEYTISFFVKSNNQSKDNFQLRLGGSSMRSEVFTATSEWVRYSYTNTPTSSIFSITSDGANDVDILIWGAQLEALPYATSYIPTYGSTVTRAAETLTGSGNSTLINSTEGVLYAEIAGLVDDDSTSNSYHRVISISDNSITNRVELKALNDGTLEFRFDSSSSDIRLYHISFDFTIFNKIALVWESGRCAAYLNGVKVVEDLTFSTFSSNALYELAFDSPYDGGSNFFYGKCKALAVFNEALEDDELELLTGVTNYGSFNELAQANGYTII